MARDTQVVQGCNFILTKDSKLASGRMKGSDSRGEKASGQARRSSQPSRSDRTNGSQGPGGVGKSGSRQRFVIGKGGGTSSGPQIPQRFPCTELETAANASTIPDDWQLAMMNKALGHPVRIKILRTLIERRACITGDLVAEFPLAQSTVSEHLRILKEAGLIQGEIEGPRTSYCVRPEGLALLKAGMGSLLDPFFDSLLED